MDFGLKNAAIFIGGGIAGVVLSQNWKTTIVPGVGKVWEEISFFTEQKPELASLAVFTVIGLVYAVYELSCYLTEKSGLLVKKPLKEAYNPLFALKIAMERINNASKTTTVNLFTIGTEVVFIAYGGKEKDDKLSKYYKLSLAKNIQVNDMLYLAPDQITNLHYIMFDIACNPYRNEKGEVAVLKDLAIKHRDLGVTSLEPKKKYRTIYGHIEGHPLPEEKPSYFRTLKKAASRRLSQLFSSNQTEADKQ